MRNYDKSPISELTHEMRCASIVPRRTLHLPIILEAFLFVDDKKRRILDAIRKNSFDSIASSLLVLKTITRSQFIPFEVRQLSPFPPNRILSSIIAARHCTRESHSIILTLIRVHVGFVVEKKGQKRSRKPRGPEKQRDCNQFSVKDSSKNYLF